MGAETAKCVEELSERSKTKGEWAISTYARFVNKLKILIIRCTWPVACGAAVCCWLSTRCSLATPPGRHIHNGCVGVCARACVCVHFHTRSWHARRACARVRVRVRLCVCACVRGFVLDHCWRYAARFGFLVFRFCLSMKDLSARLRMNQCSEDGTHYGQSKALM